MGEAIFRVKGLAQANGNNNKQYESDYGASVDPYTCAMCFDSIRPVASADKAAVNHESWCQNSKAGILLPFCRCLSAVCRKPWNGRKADQQKHFCRP
jgi:hypothetical protein